MHKLKTTVITAFVIAALFAPAALATAAKVAVVSGNGQLICTVCTYKTARYFYPMVVRVTDVNGNPITGKTVNWDLVSFSGVGLVPGFDTVSITDSDGLAFSRLNQSAGPGGSSGRPFLQSVISATADQAIASFTETIALVDTNNQTLFYSATLDAPSGPLTGPAGGTGTSPIQIRVGNFVPFPGVSVRILSPEVTSESGQVTIDPTLPSASCVTGPGADPGSVLTDATGLATCYPVFGPVAGNGFVSALVGGLDPIEFDQSLTPQPLGGPAAFGEFSNIQLIVTQVTPGRMNIISGNNQTVNAGHAASDPLVVQVTDAAGAVPVGNQSVAWSVFPTGAATLNPATSTTDAQGKAQTIVTLAANATGQVTIRATLTASKSGISAAFNLSTAVLISSLTPVSGDLQTTQSGQNFPAPLIVQVVGTNGLALPGQPIGFSVTDGVATLSTLSTLTDATGQARVTVTAGTVPGTVTVKAFIATFSTNFTLTVIPPGPALTSNSFYNAGGLTRISALSPCGLVTVLASGLAPNVQGLVFNPTSFGSWATSLATDTVLVGSVNAPIYSVGNVNGAEQLTFQVPCETAPANGVPITIGVGGGTATIAFPVVAASPGIFETVMSDGVRRAVAVRPDGTFVNLLNPARHGDTIRVFVTGLGPTNPAMVTGSVPVPGVDTLAYGQVIVGVNNGGAGPNIARVSPNLIGVYEVSFQVPSDAKTGNDIVLSVAVNVPGDTNSGGEQVTRFSNGSKLPIQ